MPLNKTVYHLRQMLEYFLKELGFTDKESTVYLSMLGIGENAVATIAKQSGLTRTTVYSVLQALVRKGLVNQIEKNRLLYFSAKRPELIGTMLDQQIRESNLQKNQFQKLLPEFQALLHRSATQPKVRYFEGLEGVIQIYEDTLKDGNDKLAYSCAPNVEDPELDRYLKEYVKRRAKLGIKARAIFPDSKAAKSHAKNAKKHLLNARLVSANKYPFRSEINIYGSKVAYISLTGNLHGVIVDSAEIATTERSIFELAWLGAQGA